MTKAQIITGPLAEVYTGSNGYCEYLVDGDDIQQRADAVCDKYWLKAGRKAEIRARNLPLWGIQFSQGSKIDVVFTSLEAANRYLSQCN